MRKRHAGFEAVGFAVILGVVAVSAASTRAGAARFAKIKQAAKESPIDLGSHAIQTLLVGEGFKGRARFIAGDSQFRFFKKGFGCCILGRSRRGPFLHIFANPISDTRVSSEILLGSTKERGLSLKTVEYDLSTPHEALTEWSYFADELGSRVEQREGVLFWHPGERGGTYQVQTGPGRLQEATVDSEGNVNLTTPDGVQILPWGKTAFERLQAAERMLVQKRYELDRRFPLVQ
jgi:hypothetical protein